MCNARCAFLIAGVLSAVISAVILTCAAAALTDEEKEGIVMGGVDEYNAFKAKYEAAVNMTVAWYNGQKGVKEATAFQTSRSSLMMASLSS